MRLFENDIKSGVYGLAVGDALGVPVEFTAREIRDKDPVREMRAYGTHNQPKGTWSDDTSMVLATMDALDTGRLSLGMIMDMFHEWLFNGDYTAGGKVFDVGNTCYNAINNWRMGEPLDRCGESDVHSNGNGSLMRMLPIAYYLYLSKGAVIDEKAIEIIFSLSGITHNHIISKICCVYYVYIAMYIMLEKDQRKLNTIIIEAIRDVDKFIMKNYKEDYCQIYNHIKHTSFKYSVSLNRGYIKSTGFVVDSLEASIWCLYNTHSYREAVELAVNLGGDTDTIGAITGSLAGLYYGIENIPKEWVEELQNKNLINSICDRFYEQYK